MRYIIFLMFLVSNNIMAKDASIGFHNEELTSEYKVFKEAMLLKEIYNINNKNKRRKIYIAVGQVEINYDKSRFIDFNEKEMKYIRLMIPEYDKVPVDRLTLSYEEKKKLTVNKIRNKHNNLIFIKLEV
jgi:hypothetical protein